MGDDADLRAQIAALTAAVQALAAGHARAEGAVRLGPRRADITFRQLAERYGKKITKANSYYLVPMVAHFGDRVVSSLRKIDWLAYREERLAAGKAIGTVNQDLTMANAMCNWGVANELLDVHPFAGIPKLKGQRARETEIDPEEDERAFSDAPLLVRAFQVACAETGARNGCEVRRIERSHIDRKRMIIKYPRANTKGQAATREVPMSEYLLWLLDELPAVAGSPFIFANPETKEPYSAAHLGRLSRPYLNRLTAAPGDGRVRTHDRRHSLVSQLARGGMNPMSSMKLIGHATPAMHWRYLHISEEDKNRMRSILESRRKRS